MSKRIFVGIMILMCLFLFGCKNSENFELDKKEVMDEIVSGDLGDIPEEANRVCTTEYAPVCGVDGETYSNECMTFDIDVAYEGECKPDINATVPEENVKICTMEYAPVCGIDGVTYGNACQADNVEVAYTGECGDFDAMIAGKEIQICTREYMPVCGADGLTYANKCEAGNMEIVSDGECGE